jgi:hypothetical protein
MRVLQEEHRVQQERARATLAELEGLRSSLTALKSDLESQVSMCLNPPPFCSVNLLNVVLSRASRPLPSR